MNSQFEATDVQQSGAEVNLSAALAGPLRARWFARALGALTRRRSPPPDSVSTDGSTLLYNRTGFLLEGELLLARCRGERRELTLAVFDCDDLPEARQVYGRRISRKLIDCIIGKMTQLAGAHGLAGRTGPTQFSVVMPMGREQALYAVGRVLGSPGRIELEGGNSEIVLVPNVMVEAVSQTGSLEKLFDALCRGLARVREQEQARHRYLEWERQRHSRPMPVQANTVAPQQALSRAARLGPHTVAMHQTPAVPTIPMALPTR